MVIASMTKKGSLFSRLFICSCIFYSDQNNLINTIVLYVLYGFAPLCMAPFQCQSSCFSAYWLSISRGHWTRGSLRRDSGLERHRGWSWSDRWTHTFSPVRLTFNLEKWIYTFTHRCYYTHMSTHFSATATTATTATATATYVPSCISLFSCILPFGRRLHSFFLLPLLPEN